MSSPSSSSPEPITVSPRRRTSSPSPAEPFDSGLWRIGEELSPLFADVEPVDLDTELYGPLEADS